MKNQHQRIEDTFAGYDEIEESMFLAEGTRIFNKYEILLMLGFGGMGQVYLAKDLQLGRLVAIKTLSVENNCSIEHKNRFLREAQMAAAVNHPNVLTIYEAGFEGNRPFLVMEYVEGQTLRELISSKEMDLALALNLAIQLAQGLLATHKMGIIHRDLKLDNFILRRDGYLKILDFGLAKNTSEKESVNKFETRVGIVLGTPRYMSPEQARGQELDSRSDIFSFGSVVYELLTNQLAFDDEDDMQALYQVVFYPPPPMPETIPVKLRQIIEKTMEKKANARPQSMQEVLDVLLEVRDEICLATEKSQINYLFASTYIAPVSKPEILEPKRETKEKKFDVLTSTQTNPVVDDIKINLEPKFLSPLFELPISRIVGFSSHVRPNNIFFESIAKGQIPEPKSYLDRKQGNQIFSDYPSKVNKIIRFPTIKQVRLNNKSI